MIHGTAHLGDNFRKSAGAISWVRLNNCTRIKRMTCLSEVWSTSSEGAGWNCKTNCPCKFGNKIIVNNLVRWDRWGLRITGQQADRLADTFLEKNTNASVQRQTESPTAGRRSHQIFGWMIASLRSGASVLWRWDVHRYCRRLPHTSRSETGLVWQEL